TLLQRCSTKDRKQRLQAIGEARIVLEQPVDRSVGSTRESGRRRQWLATSGAIALLLLIGALALWGWLRPTPGEKRTITRFTIPASIAIVSDAVVVSRDGSKLAFVGGAQQQIYVRKLDDFEARPLPGTDGASMLCFSPDGDWISFITGERATSLLKKVA